MELRHLRYFIAVVEQQSFTKAAEKLFIAQPPLSRQIQNLEEELGVQLLERGSRPVKTTEVGDFFYQYAVKLVSNADNMISMTKRISSVEKIMRIGFVGSLLFGLLPRIINLYRQDHPHLKIELYEMGTKAQVEALKDGKIDVGFGRLKFSDPAIKRTLLRNERLYVAVAANHRLNQFKQQGVSLSELIDEKILCYPTTAKPNFATHVLSIFSDHGLEPNFVNEVREVQLALGLSAAGEGITIVPESSQAIKLNNLNYIPLIEPDAISPIFIISRNISNNEYIDSLMTTIHRIYIDEGFENNLTQMRPQNP